MATTETISCAVVEEVAKREGVDPVDLTPALYDAIETEAVETLFSDSVSSDQRNSVSLTFSYCGYEITIGGEDDIQVRNPSLTRR